MALSFRIRRAQATDGEALVAIEMESFPDASWSAEDFLRYECTVAEVIVHNEAAIGGFLVSRQIDGGDDNTPPEREILNLAVSKVFRRQGIGSQLLADELRRGATLFLEVRESNAPAIQLYRNAGFSEISRRSDYYKNPVESAIVMRVK